MIQVVNKRFHKPTEYDQYIGRPSPLGNPYSHLDNSRRGTIKVATREEAIRLYDEWFEKQWTDYTEVAEAVDDLVDQYLATSKMYLVCWCAPAACHGDIVKKSMEEIIANLRKT